MATEFEFLISEEAVNNLDMVDWEAFERAQDGDIKMYRLRPAMCRFMVDKDNKPIPYAQALKLSEKMKLKEGKAFVTRFFEMMQNSAVPKANGSASKSPIEVEPAGSLSQVGS